MPADGRWDLTRGWKVQKSQYKFQPIHARTTLFALRINPYPAKVENMVSS